MCLCRLALQGCSCVDRVCSTSGQVIGWGGRVCWTIPSCRRRRQRRCGGRQLWPTPSRPPQTAGLGRARAALLRVWPRLSAPQPVCICSPNDEHKPSGTVLLLAEALVPVAQQHRIAFMRKAPQTCELVIPLLLGFRCCAGSGIGVRDAHDQGSSRAPPAGRCECRIRSCRAAAAF